jgi:hypothetical protein
LQNYESSRVRVGRVVQCHTGDGNYLEIFANGSAEPKPEGCIIHFALRTDNCDAAVERARAAGVVITTEPKDVAADAGAVDQNMVAKLAAAHDRLMAKLIGTNAWEC